MKDGGGTPSLASSGSSWNFSSFRALLASFSVLVFMAVVVGAYFLWQRDRLTKLERRFRSFDLFVILDCLGLLAAVFALLMCCKMFVSLLRAIQQCLHFSAAIVLVVVSTGFVSVLCWLTWTLLLKSRWLEEHIPHHIAIPCMLPWFLSISYNMIAFVANAVLSLGWIWKRMLSCLSCLGKASHLYAHATLEKELSVARPIYADAKKRLSRVPNQPLLGETESVSVTQWAQLLQDMVDINDDLRFPQDSLRSLMYAVYGGEKASLCDLLRFHVLYVPCLVRVAVKSFTRNLILDRAKSAINKIRHVDGCSDQVLWQLLVDQYDWYLKNGYCLSDVLALLVERDDCAGRVVWFLKVVDDALAPFLTFLCLKPLWIPSPEHRMRDISNRLAVLTHLTSGRIAYAHPTT